MADEWQETGGGPPQSVALHATTRDAGTPEFSKQVTCNDAGELLVSPGVAGFPVTGTVQTNETPFASWGTVAEQVSAQNTTGTQLASQATTGGFTVVAHEDNADNVFLGPSASTCVVRLEPGSSMSFPLTNTNQVWFRTPTTGDGVYILYWTV